MEHILEKLHEVKMTLQPDFQFGGVYFNKQDIFVEYLQYDESRFFQLSPETVTYLSTNDLKILFLSWYLENESTLSITG